MNFTFLLKAYAKYRNNQLSKINPVQKQEEELLKLINSARKTKFGRDHNFESITSIEDYQSKVPPRKYEDFWKEYWQKEFPKITNCTWPGTIPYFPVTSGTTSGTTKYIPLTKEMEKSNTKAALDILVHHVNNYPNSKLLAGKNFFLGGSTTLIEEEKNIYSGDLSGMVAKNLPWYVKPFYFPPKELSLIDDWEEKINVFAKESLKEKISLISGVPAWMLIYFDKLFELKPEANRNLNNIFENLEILIHGGVNFAPYEKQFRKLIDEEKTQLREVYPASEGFIAIADRNYGEGLKLNIDNGIFYEFIPLDELKSENPTRHWIGNVQKDINYAIALTTCSGIWSYIIGDTVKFVDTENPRILITGRTSYTLSAFGEHLIADEIEDAVSTASNDINYSVKDYSVGAVFPKDESDLGGHLYIVEFGEKNPSAIEIERFSNILDRKLCERNEDYKAHRADGYGLKKPEIIPVESGYFADWMKSRGKLGGQHKVPRIITNQELFHNLKAFKR